MTGLTWHVIIPLLVTVFALGTLLPLLLEGWLVIPLGPKDWGFWWRPNSIGLGVIALVRWA